MWSKEYLVQQLQQLGVRPGIVLLVHTCLQCIGPMEQEVQTLLEALLEALGAEGTLLVPAFNFDAVDPLERLPEAALQDGLESMRARVPLYDVQLTPAAPALVGELPECVRRHPRAVRSMHPLFSFAAIGPKAEALTRNVPFHYPLGSQSPPARLHDLNGYVLLAGTGHRRNASLYLAEVWAEAPYIHRRIRVKTGEDVWTEMEGSPECSEGFCRIEPLLKQARVQKNGTLGNAEACLMPQRMLLSMAVAMLRGDSKSLLCSNPECAWCCRARKLCAEVEP